MTKSILFFAFLLLTISSVAQSFEGNIIYKTSYKSKIPGATDEQLSTMMGATQDYFIKDGDYKSVMNGTLLQWQLYINQDNKLYAKMANNETIFWNDGAVNPDEVLKTEINKNSTEVLGYRCDEIILTCKSGIYKYYFNAKFAVSPELFRNHKFGNWYEFISRSGALPLKYVIDSQQFTMESIAIEIKEMKLDKNQFELPPNAKTTKSPY
jgi:hypothetical protein